MSGPYLKGPARPAIAVANAAALRAIDPDEFIANELAYMASPAKLLKWDPASVAADNGTTVIKPTSVSGAGRWVDSAAGGIPVGTTTAVPYFGSMSGGQTVQGVLATPGWQVLSKFKYVAAAHVASGGTLTRLFHSTVVASTALLQVRTRMVRADTLVLVAGSLLTFAPSVATEAYAETADLTSALVDGVIYQTQMEVTGGAAASDFGSANVGLRVVYSY